MIFSYYNNPSGMPSKGNEAEDQEWTKIPGLIKRKHLNFSWSDSQTEQTEYY